MACFHPLKAVKVDGRIVFVASGQLYTLQLPCGQCVGCRMERSRQWAVRCMHEASLHDENCFVTLTYDDDHLPADKSLHYRHFQLFNKRLRQHFEPKTIRFYMAGEYGEKFGRPHFHSCYFGLQFPDRRLHQKTSSGSMIYTSKILESLWPFGFSSIGDLNFQSAAYVARYVMKKMTGPLAKDHYEWIDPETGQIHCRTPEFNRMSLKPGIGADWIEKYKDDVYPNDYVVVRGKKCKPPRYYDTKLEKIDPIEFLTVKEQRKLDALKRASDNTPARLLVREEVAKARLSSLKRSLK